MSDQLRNSGTPARREIPFRAFDPTAETRHQAARLENWEQPGTCYFETFRLGGSIPFSVQDEWRKEREVWNKLYPKPWSDNKIQEYEERSTQRQEKWLDRGIGECHLLDPRLRALVLSSLWKFDSQRYFIDSFVIMPNHVDLLWQVDEKFTNTDQLKRLKGATARACNSVLKTSGSFWMEGSYNRIVKNDSELFAYRDYIEANPVKASLTEDRHSLAAPHILKTYG